VNILPLHIAGGALALVFGYVALFAPKGRTVHRKSGLFFVAAMVVMSLTGAWIALGNTPSSVIAGLLTFYFVTTSLLTVRPRFEHSRSIDAAAMVYGLATAALAFKIGFDILGKSPEAIPMFIFGAMGVLGAIGDARVMRAGGIQGPRRIARHLWRMCFAMWVAAASFFWGPVGRVPDIIYYPALLPIPVLAPIAVMLYWLFRIRVKKTLRGLVSVGAPETAAFGKS
jgi:uncharacterized membrane protein